jgi:rhodanese-related sulfurtransferase
MCKGYAKIMKSGNSIKMLSRAILLSVLIATNQSQAAEDIDVKHAQLMNRQGALLLDVREPDEYAEVHAPNATLIPLGQLGTRLNEIAAYKNKPVAVMCHSGKRSAKAAHLLEEAGFSQVSNVSGGIMAWEKEGLQVIRK